MCTSSPVKSQVIFGGNSVMKHRVSPFVVIQLTRMLLNGLCGNDSDALQLFSFFPVLLLTKFTKKNYRAMKIFAVASSFSDEIFSERQRETGDPV